MRRDVPYGHASMLLLGEGSEATEPYNKYDKIRPQSIRSLQFDQKVRPLSFRPEKFDLIKATPEKLRNEIMQPEFNGPRTNLNSEIQCSTWNGNNYKAKKTYISWTKTDNKRSDLQVEKLVYVIGAGTFRHQPFGLQKFQPISATIMWPKCPVD